MAKDRDRDRERDSDNSATSQSKRPTLNHHGSDSQVSGDAAQHASSSNIHSSSSSNVGFQQPPRSKTAKHVVGGGTAGRFHPRVPSSKALHKHHVTSASTSKLHRRQVSSPSPPPDRGPPVSPLAASHRRTTSDVRLPRELSLTNLSKNNSQSTLKRNRSHVEVGKRTKSSEKLKRTSSNPAVNKLKSNKTQVHFDLGEDGQDEEDEWVDASNSASPYLSRRGSVNSSGQSSAKPTASREASRPQTPLDATEPPAHSSSDEGSSSDNRDPLAPDREKQHQEYLTSRLLQRTPSHGAPPQMSTTNVSVSLPGPQPRRSPDSGESASTLSGTPRTTTQHLSSSNGKDELTSRFVVTSSHGSGSAITGDSSSFANSPRGTSSRPGTAKSSESSAPRRPHSLGNLAEPKPSTQATAIRYEDVPHLTDDEENGLGSSAPASKANPRRKGYAAYAAEKSRTQQKLNLQRASSSLEPSHHHHHSSIAGIPSAVHGPGPLIGGTGYDARDPRVGKILERTGMEYLVVRRYQNPVARSLIRLGQLQGADKARHIPRGSGTAPGLGGAHAKRVSDLNPARQGLESRDGPQLSAAGVPKQAVESRRTFSSIRSSGAGSSFEGEEDHRGRPPHETTSGGLSGASLVDGDDDDGTVALLRNLWEKNLDLTSSQE